MPGSILAQRPRYCCSTQTPGYPEMFSILESGVCPARGRGGGGGDAQAAGAGGWDGRGDTGAAAQEFSPAARRGRGTPPLPTRGSQALGARPAAEASVDALPRGMGALCAHTAELGPRGGARQQWRPSLDPGRRGCGRAGWRMGALPCGRALTCVLCC